MSSSDNDSDWSDIADEEEFPLSGEEEEVQSVQCPFCSYTCGGCEDLFTHIKTEHNLNLKHIIHKVRFLVWFSRFFGPIQTHSSIQTPVSSVLGSYNKEELLKISLNVLILLSSQCILNHI